MSELTGSNDQIGLQLWVVDILLTESQPIQFSDCDGEVIGFIAQVNVNIVTQSCQNFWVEVGECQRLQTTGLPQKKADQTGTGAQFNHSFTGQ